MPQPAGQSCTNCAFWFADLIAMDRGKCHRYPPLLNPVWAPMGQFITCYRADWCGEWNSVAPRSSASVNLGPTGNVAAGATISLPQSAPALTGTSFSFSAGKLSLTVAGTVTFNVTFALQSASILGSGQLWVNGVSVITSPLTLQSNHGTATFTYTALCKAGDVFEVAFVNQDTTSRTVTSGTLSVSEIGTY